MGRSVRQLSNIRVETEGRIVCVVIDDPDHHNAFSQRGAEELRGVLEEYRDDPELWAMIITGEGTKSFCAGMNLVESAESTEQEGRAQGYSFFKPFTDLMQSIDKPFICAVNGYCIGGGWHFVADADITIGSTAAVFLDTHVNLGLVNGVESAGLAFKMPLGIVMRMVIEGRRFRVNAEQAYQWGLLSEVCAPEELYDRAWSIAANIATETAPLAVRTSKRAILEALELGPKDGIANGWKMLDAISESSDTVEGLKAFVERRSPNFTGR